MGKTKVNVLLVDDDPIYQFVACKTLEYTGLTDKIYVRSNGEDGYRFLLENANNADELPDVIFLDINMPVMNGWEFLEIYQSLKPTLAKDIPVYLLTSSMSEEDKKFSQRYSCVQEYVIKPFVKEKIMALLTAAGAHSI